MSVERISHWRENARHCVERVYDAQQIFRFSTGQAKTKGNALCAYKPCVHRCTFNLCPLRKSMAQAAPPEPLPQEGRPRG